jgi:hypothetical protein
LNAGDEGIEITKILTATLSDFDLLDLERPAIAGGTRDRLPSECTDELSDGRVLCVAVCRVGVQPSTKRERASDSPITE